jgi:hypothetical protein
MTWTALAKNQVSPRDAAIEMGCDVKTAMRRLEEANTHLHRGTDWQSRRSREALAVACEQCKVAYGPVAVADGIKHDQYLSRKIIGEHGGEVTETIRVHWEMTNNREALLFRGA